MDIPFDSIKPEHFLTFPKKRRSARRKASVKCQTPKKKTKRKHAKDHIIKINPSLQDVIVNALKGIQAPLKHYPGYLRFTAPPSGPHYDRTLTDWITTIKQNRSNSVLFPFIRSENEALEQYFRAQQRLRRFAERCTRKQILKTIEAKEHDNCDLYTMEPIPARSMVAVYNIVNRTKYMFHTQTAIKMLQTSLTYSAYGIAAPSAPKNPYTNVPWTIAELATIVGQIGMNLLRNHQFPPKLLMDFRYSTYCHKKFYADHWKALNIAAATTFFGLTDDVYRDSVYEEIIDDQYKILNVKPRCTALVMSKTKLPADLKKEWDDLVLASFLESNLDTFTDAFKSTEEIHDAFKDLHERTIVYRPSLRRRTVSASWGADTDAYLRRMHIHITYRDEEPQYAEDNTDANWLQSIVIEGQEEEDTDANWLQAIQVDEDAVNIIVVNKINTLHNDIIGPDGTIWEIKYTPSA
jgi:hypothetical protein